MAHHPDQSSAAPEGAYFGRDLEGMGFAVNYHREIIRHFGDDIGARVLEVGAGSGNFSAFIAERGVSEHVALEPSENMFPLLQAASAAHPNRRPRRAILSELAEHETGYDSIFYVNVLEHIKDDAAELREAHARLAPGGKLLIFIPAVPWLFGTADVKFGHHRRYYKPELVRLVEAAGFKVERARYFDMVGMVPWWILFVLLKRPCFSPGNVKLYDNIVVPLASIFGRRFAPPIGKNILLVATK